MRLRLQPVTATQRVPAGLKTGPEPPLPQGPAPVGWPPETASVGRLPETAPVGKEWERAPGRTAPPEPSSERRRGRRGRRATAADQARRAGRRLGSGRGVDAVTRGSGGWCRRRAGRSAARARAARYGGERSPRRNPGTTLVRRIPGGGGRIGGLGRLLRRGGLFGLDRAAQTLGIGLTADAVGLRVLDGGRVALDPDPEGKGQLQPLLIGEA